MSAAKIGVAVLLAASFFGASAAADDTPDVGKLKDGVDQIRPLKIVGHPRVPLSIDVARVVQRVPLAELRQPLADRIGKAVDKDPF